MTNPATRQVEFDYELPDIGNWDIQYDIDVENVELIGDNHIDPDDIPPWNFY